MNFCLATMQYAKIYIFVFATQEIWTIYASTMLCISIMIYDAKLFEKVEG